MRYLCFALLALCASAALVVHAADTPTPWPGVYWHTLECNVPNVKWITSDDPMIGTFTGTMMTLPALRDSYECAKPLGGCVAAPVAATPESVEVKDNKDGTATVTVTVTVKAVVGDTASVARQRALVTAAAACNDAAHAERMTDAEIEAQRAKDIAEANAKADRLKASRPKEK